MFRGMAQLRCALGMTADHVTRTHLVQRGLVAGLLVDFALGIFKFVFDAFDAFFEFDDPTPHIAHDAGESISEEQEDDDKYDDRF